jgi:hypothetical protein
MIFRIDANSLGETPIGLPMALLALNAARETWASETPQNGVLGVPPIA